MRFYDGDRQNPAVLTRISRAKCRPRIQVMKKDSKPRILLVGGPDVHLRIDLMKKLKREFNVGAVGSSESLRADFAEHGFEYFTYKMSRRANLFNDLIGFLQLIILFRQQRPDVIHTFATKPSIWGRLAGYIAGVPIIVGTLPGLGSLYVVNSPKTKLIRFFYEVIQRLACTVSDLTVFQNRDDADEFVKYKVVNATDVKIIPGSGVDITKFNPDSVSDSERSKLRAELGISDDKLVVTMIARLTKSKGVYDFVQSAIKIKKTFANVEFLIVGYADESIDRLSSDEFELLQKNVVWPGPRKDIPEVMAASDIFVLPTAYREGMPRVLLEAAAMKLPAVTTNMPGCKDVVQDRVTGLLTEPKNVESLTEAIAELVDAPELRSSLGERARVNTVERLSLSAISAQTIDMYKGLLQNRNSIGGIPLGGVLTPLDN